MKRTTKRYALVAGAVLLGGIALYFFARRNSTPAASPHLATFALKK